MARKEPRTIGSADKYLLGFGEGLRKNVVNNCRAFSSIAQEAVKGKAPVDTGRYRESIKRSVDEDGNEITVTVYSDLLIKDIKTTEEATKWDNVPLGCFLEWGTGIRGYVTNEYDHGYPYTMDWMGMVAQPHFQPTYQEMRPAFKRMMRDAVKKTIRGH